MSYVEKHLNIFFAQNWNTEADIFDEISACRCSAQFGVCGLLVTIGNASKPMNGKLDEYELK